MTQIPEPPPSEFPSLTAAATTKTKKKNKPQTLSLADFNTYSTAAQKPNTTTAEPKRLTQDEILRLPTGPRERTAEEMERDRIGGGFRNYGGERGSRVLENRRENSNRERVELGPSRADEVDDWSKTKKFNSLGSGPGERREKGGFFNSSRADEVANWASNKSFVDGPRRERRGFDSYSNGSGADSDHWLRKKEERVGNGVEGDTWGRRESNGLGNGPSGRPKLKLQPRTLPVVRDEGSDGGTAVGKVKGANPFGAARPREEVLKEKGKDWKEMEEKLEAGKRNGEKSEGFGRRRGLGMGRSDSGDDRSWRKPEAGEVVASTTEARFDSVYHFSF